MKRLRNLLANSVSKWSEDKASSHGAALAYYTVFSLGPFLVILIALSGWIFGKEAIEGEIVGEIQNLIGREGAQAVQTLVAGAMISDKSGIAALIGVVVLLIGASGVFGQLEESLNSIWKVPPPPDAGWWFYIKSRFVSFAMVLSLGFLFIVSLSVSTAVTALATSATSYLPGPDLPIVWIDYLLSFALISFIFATLFKWIPNTHVNFWSALKGGAVTTVLFFIGKILMGIYLGNSDLASTYGVAASIMILLLWVYYSAQIFLLGAEFVWFLERQKSVEFKS